VAAAQGQRRSPRPTMDNSAKSILYVGGLEENVNEAILHSAFIPFGDIKDVNIPLDQSTQKNRGFGFVDFVDKDDAAAAIDNMHNSELYGKVLKVNIARPDKKATGNGIHGVWADADTWVERQQQEEARKTQRMHDKGGEEQPQDAMAALEQAKES